MQKVLTTLETNHRTATAYRPQAKERLNHALTDMLAMYVSAITPTETEHYNLGHSPITLVDKSLRAKRQSF